ncbi:peptidase inhibitor family I36 protein [Glycomyces luteolus]|uniref:Peptidase inhibitor family I36 protein n=1 Tax=Glycomyces luteolus TaxID=2670330 RepID=A0A9X3SQ45_9ACTN|nr:peptidase inhibitor family I36 protein [Glycomyces luteolus]MDA1360117.1 peptidase inhibitor family I36 protein [Glycomyces luteolus]
MRKHPKATDATSLPRKRTPAVLLALTATALLATASPAAASTSDTTSTGDCPFTETLCLFEGPGFTGERFTVSSLVEPGTCVSLVDHGWAGRVNSAINTHTSSAALFANDDCVGGPYQVPGSSSITDLGGFEPLSLWVAG